MRRGQLASDRVDPGEGWTKQQLLDAGNISAKLFDSIRKAARVPGPSHGGLNWVFPSGDVITIVRRAESGRFSERGTDAAKRWRALLAEHGVHFEA